MNRRGNMRLGVLSQKLARKRLLAGVVALSVPVVMTGVAQAGSATWQGTGGVLGSWGDVNNWVGQATIPGNTSASTNSDVATFDATGNFAVPIDLGASTWTLGTVAVNAPGYTFTDDTLDIDAIVIGSGTGATVFTAGLTDQNNDGLVINTSVAQTAATLSLNGATVSSTANAIVGTSTTLLNRAAFTMYGANGPLIGLTTTGTYSIAGGAYFSNVNTASLGGAWTVGGNFLVENAGAVTFITGGGNSYSVGGDLQTTGSTLNISTGSVVSVGGNLIAGAVTSGVGTNGTPTINIGQALTSFGGTVIIAGGTVNVNVSDPFVDNTKIISIAPSTAASQATALAVATGLTLDNPITVGTGAGTTTISGASNSIYNGSITLGKSIILNNIGTAATVTQFNGAITGAGASLTIGTVGTGIVQLSSSNTFGGVGSSVTINAGLARIAASSGLGDPNNSINFNGGGIQLNGNAIDITNIGRSLTFNAGKTFTFDTNSVATTTFANTFGGGTSANFTKAGVGTLILGAAETYSGTTSVTGGTLQSSFTTNGFGTGSSISLAAGTLALRSNTSATFGSTAAPTGYSFNIATSSTIDVNNNGSGTGQTLSLGAGTIAGVTLSVTGGNGYTLSTGALTQSIAGTTILGPTTGVLSLGGFTSFTSGASTLSFRQTGTTIVNGAIVNGGGTLNMDRSNQTGTTIIAVASPAFGTGTVAVTNGVLQTAIMTNAFGNGVISMGGGTLSLKSDTSQTFGQNVGTPGAYNFATTNSTTISATPVTSAAVGTAITVGNLTFGAAHVLNATGSIGLNIGAATSNYAGGATANGFANAIAAASGTLMIASMNYAAMAADTKFTISGVGKTTITGGIGTVGSSAGILSVTYSGTNTLSINGASTYTGQTSISSSSGTLSVGNDLALGTGTIGSNGATLLAAGGTRTLANGYVTSGSTTIGGTDLVLTGGVFNGSIGAGVLTINNNTTISTSPVYIRNDVTGGLRTMTIGGSGNMVINSAILNGLAGTANDGSANSQLVYNGTGSLALNGANTYQGSTAITQGTVFIGTNAPIGSLTPGAASGAFGNAAATSVVSLGSGTLTGAIQVLTTGAFTIDRTLAETATANTSFLIGGKQTSGTSTYTGGIGFSKDSTIASGTGGEVDFTGAWNTLNKNVTVGTNTLGGTVRLATSGMATAGAVNVAFGNLQVDSGISGGGTIAGATALTVANGASLVGAGGTITKAVNVNGVLAPGSAAGSVGILNIVGSETVPTAGQASLTLGATGSYKVDLAGTTTTAGTNFDQTNVTGTVDLGNSTLTIVTNGLTLSANEFFPILTNDGTTDAILNAFNGLAQDGTVITQDGFNLNISYIGEGFNSSGGNDVVLYTSAVPEPASLGLIGLGTIGLLSRRRRAKAAAR